MVRIIEVHWSRGKAETCGRKRVAVGRPATQRAGSLSVQSPESTWQPLSLFGNGCRSISPTGPAVPRARAEPDTGRDLTIVSFDDTILNVVNKKHRITLQAVFDDPVRSNIAWRDIEALFAAAGAEITEGAGSRVRITLNGIRAVFHRPHPQKETDKGAVRSVRRFLTEAEVTP